MWNSFQPKAFLERNENVLKSWYKSSQNRNMKDSQCRVSRKLLKWNSFEVIPLALVLGISSPQLAIFTSKTGRLLLSVCIPSISLTKSWPWIVRPNTTWILRTRENRYWSKANFSFQFMASYVWYSMEKLAGDLFVWITVCWTTKSPYPLHTLCWGQVGRIAVNELSWPKAIWLDSNHIQVTCW